MAREMTGSGTNIEVCEWLGLSNTYLEFAKVHSTIE